MSRQPDPNLLAASEAILTDRYNTARADANREMTYSVYVMGTQHTEPIDPAAKIVEDVLRADMIAKARFHSEQESRFAAALDELRAWKPKDTK